jgi:large subunit GTPase 1
MPSLQVIDGRDPLTYFSQDLVDYAASLTPAKPSLVLLNKSDLLPPPVRAAWARYFAARGVQCAFWSAIAATEAQAAAKAAAAAGAMGYAADAAAPPTAHPAASMEDEQPEETGGMSTRVIGVEELLEWMEEHAAAAVAAGGGRR